MPVTAKLSLLFYEKLGEQVATELVDWFNSVDATYRSDLRELNELNFARFDAKVEQRIGALDAKLEQRLGVFEAKVERRLAEMRSELRIDLSALESRMDHRFALMDARFDSLEGKLIGRFEGRIAKVRTEMLRWMLASWSSMMLVLLGTLLAVLRTR